MTGHRDLLSFTAHHIANALSNAEVALCTLTVKFTIASTSKEPSRSVISLGPA